MGWCPSSIRKAIGKTRTIITKYVHSTGFKQDLETLSEIWVRRISSVVNATQSIGALNFDVGKFGVDLQ
jgi:cysteine sulfinate desulfinase/cysteine desulfurase-like protein